MAGKTLADGYVELRADASKLPGDVRNGLRATNFERLAAAHGKAYGDGFARQAKNSISGGLKDLARGALTLFAPAAIAGAVAQIGKIGMAYEDNLNIFKSVTKATGGQMDQVAAKARKLGADVTLPGVSAAGAAAAMTELAKAGLTVQQSMDAATGTLRLARAAGIDEASAAGIAASAVNAFGLAAKDVTFVADELAAAANSSSVEVTDVADAFKMAASVFSGFQGPAVGSKEAITELNTAVAILGNNGIRGSDAGTSLKQMLLQLAGPTQAAKDQMQLLAQRAGGATISLAEQNAVLHGSKKVRDAAIQSIAAHNAGLKNSGDIAYDASGKMRPLTEIIDLVTRGTKGMTQEERNFAITQIFGADASRSVIALMKGGLPAYEAQRKAVLQAGAAASVAAAKNAGLGGAIDNVRSQVENAAISVYNIVKGPLTSSLNDFAGKLPGAFAAVGSFFAFLGQHMTTVKALGATLLTLTAITRTYAAVTAVQAVGGLVAWIAQTSIAMSVTRVWTAVMWAARAPMLAYTAALALGNSTLGVWVGVKGIEFAAWVRTTAATVASTAATVAHTVVTKAVQVATIAWTGVQWALNAALTANPIGLVIAAIAALIAIVVIAYKKNETFRNIVNAVWAGIKVAIKAVGDWFVNVLWPSLKRAYEQLSTGFDGMKNQVVGAWNAVRNGVSGAYGWMRDNVFTPLRNLITKTIPAAFNAGKDAIGRAWNAIKDLASKPVAFVVNSVYNPLARGFNAAASAFGVGTRLAEIRGFAGGGHVRGPGGPRDDLIHAMLSNGEYVIPSNVVQGLGVGFFDRLIGRPSARRPGDGSEGLAFADGGLVGFIKDVWSGLSNPTKLIARPINAAINRIPGGGAFRDIVAGMGHQLVGGLLSWLSGASGGAVGGNVGKAMGFIRAQAGKPYVWAAAGPGGYDCSGIVSAVWNLLHGRNPYSHTFSTMNEAAFFPKSGPGLFTAAWANAGEAGGGSVGHTAARLGNLLFESRGDTGVHLGPSVTPLSSFAHLGHYARGGLVGLPFGSYDTGGYLPPGLSVAHNGTGRPEPVGHRMGNTYTINVQVAPGGHPAEVGRQVVESIKAFEQANGNRWRSGT